MATRYKTQFIIFGKLRFLNYTDSAKFMTRKPKIGNWTNMTKLYPFLESKKSYLLFKGILWSRDLLVKTIVILRKHFKNSLQINTNLFQFPVLV